MKKTAAFLILLVNIYFLNAQEKNTLILGKIILKDSIAKEIHVVNKQQHKGTITDNNGLFNITVKVGDTLFFSHIKLENKDIIITNITILQGKITVYLDEKTEILNEFVLEKKRSIFYQDPEIITYNGPVVNAKNLNLPYAESVAEKEKNILNFKSGAVVSLDNLINSFNGNNKRTMQLKKMSLEDIEIQKIRTFFTDSFFVVDLKIEKEYINLFLNDCLDKNIIRIFNEDNSLKLTKILISESKLFPKKVIDEKLLLTNN